MEDPSHGFLTRLMICDLGNPFKTVVHHHLFGEIISLSHQDEFLMVIALVYIVAHWTKPMMSYNIGYRV